MTSLRSPKPLDLKFRPSRWLCGYFVALHSAALAGFWLVLPTLLAFISSILVAASAFYYMRRDVYFRLPQSIARIAFADNDWRIYRGDIRHLANVKTQHVDLLEAITLPYGVVLRFRLANGRAVSIVILPDNIGVDQYRRLRQISNFSRVS